MATRSELDATLDKLRDQLPPAGSQAAGNLDYRTWKTQLDAVADQAWPKDIAYVQGRAQAILGLPGLIPAEVGPWEAVLQEVGGDRPGWLGISECSWGLSPCAPVPARGR